MHSIEKCIIITLLPDSQKWRTEIRRHFCVWCRPDMRAVWLQSQHFQPQCHHSLIKAWILSSSALLNPVRINHGSLCTSPLQSLFINSKPENLGFSLPGMEPTQFTGWMRCWVILFTGLLRFREILPQETPQCERDIASHPISPSAHAFVWLGCGHTICLVRMWTYYPLEKASNPFLFP